MSSDSEPRGIAAPSSASALEAYLHRVRQLGAVEGPGGAAALSPTLRPVLEAMHHLLAGGEVEVRVVRAGQPDIFQELQQHAEQVLAEANAVGSAAGTIVVTAV